MRSFSRASWSVLLCALLATAGCGDDQSPGGPGGGGDGGGGGGVPETGRLEGITAEHNTARANVDPPADPPIPPLTWDPSVAAVAQGWADQLAANDCPLQHSSNGYGENLFVTSGSASPADVVDLWVREGGCYEYETNTCFPGTCDCIFFQCMSCGHYTQVVWRDSERLGCGVADCPGGGEIWVCNYDPPGNVIPPGGTSPSRPY